MSLKVKVAAILLKWVFTPKRLYASFCYIISLCNEGGLSDRLLFHTVCRTFTFYAFFPGPHKVYKRDTVTGLYCGTCLRINNVFCCFF